MDLNDFIPDNSANWSVSKDQLLYKRCGFNLPMCIIEDNKAFIFIDNALPKPTLKLIKHLLKLDIEFYFYPPTYSHPGQRIDNNSVIFHYFMIYSNLRYFTEFEKMDFDLIKNLVDWTKLENCFDLIKPNFTEALEVVNKSWHNGYQRQKLEYEYSEIIRDDFRSIYRHILISQIL